MIVCEGGKSKTRGGLERDNDCVHLIGQTERTRSGKGNEVVEQLTDDLRRQCDVSQDRFDCRCRAIRRTKTARGEGEEIGRVKRCQTVLCLSCKFVAATVPDRLRLCRAIDRRVRSAAHFSPIVSCLPSSSSLVEQIESDRVLDWSIPLNIEYKMKRSCANDAGRFMLSRKW